MKSSNTVRELANELKDSVQEIKEFTSSAKNSMENIDNSINGNESEQPSTCKEMDVLETKSTLQEGKPFTYFGDNLSKNVDQSTCHPLGRNHLIMRPIFELLDLSSLKSCRQVCKYWKELSEPVLKKKVKIEFKSYSEKRSLDQFTSDFPLDSVPCNNFVFESMITCSMSKFTNFFRLNAEMMTSLEMAFVDLVDEDGKVNSCNIDNLIGPNIMNLKIKGSLFYGSYTQIILSVDTLKCVKHLDLHSCVLVIPEECVRIQPEVISLDSVSFTRPSGHQINHVRLNDFIDFHKSKKIHFDGSYNFNKYNERISLFFPPGIELENVNISAVTYYWKLINRPKIKNIRMSSADMKVNFLSEQVEHLNFTLISETDQQNIFLPNLKSITCPTSNGNVLPQLPIFKNCPNLVAINLQNVLGRNLELNLNWLPQFVQKVKLDGIRIVGDRFDRKLTSLHLLNYSWPTIHTIMNNINTDNLYISISELTPNRRLTPVSTDTLMSILQQPYKTFAIGKIMWVDQDNFLNSEFSNLVDKRSECYLFEDGKGKAIPNSEWENFMKLFP